MNPEFVKKITFLLTEIWKSDMLNEVSSSRPLPREDNGILFNFCSSC